MFERNQAESLEKLSKESLLHVRSLEKNFEEKVTDIVG
jgi:hypothetical protein